MPIRGVGDVLLERSNRAKHLGLSIRPFKGARVAVPHGVSFAAAEKFAHSKTNWIKKHLEKMTFIEKQAEVLQESHLIDRDKAKKHLVERLDELCKRNGFKYNRVFAKNQKTRWGSCSDKINGGELRNPFLCFFCLAILTLWNDAKILLDMFFYL